MTYTLQVTAVPLEGSGLDEASASARFTLAAQEGEAETDE